MTRSLAGKLIITGAMGVAAAGLSPATGIVGHAQCNAAPVTFNNPCFAGNFPTAVSSANQSANTLGLSLAIGNNNIAQSYAVTNQVSVQKTTANTGTIETGHHRVVVGGRSFAANGVGGAFVSEGVGGAANTGGAALAG